MISSLILREFKHPDHSRQSLRSPNVTGGQCRFTNLYNTLCNVKCNAFSSPESKNGERSLSLVSETTNFLMSVGAVYVSYPYALISPFVYLNREVGRLDDLTEIRE
jgi:hypothetical protein